MNCLPSPCKRNCSYRSIRRFGHLHDDNDDGGGGGGDGGDDDDTKLK